MLGLQLHGRPDAVVLSIFEDAPLAAAAEAKAPPSRYHTRHPVAATVTARQQTRSAGGVGHAEAGGSRGADPAVGNSAEAAADPWSLCSSLELQQVRTCLAA